MRSKKFRMGSTTSWRQYYGVNDDDNDDSGNSPILTKTISCYFRQLSEKRASWREEALSGIVKILVHEIEVDFVENNFVTLVHYCFRCIRKSRVAKELENAVYTIGLVAMITKCVDTSHEVYVDVFSAISNGLKSKVDIGKVLECLAIVTFFGAKNSDETEQAMQLIWSFILPAPGSTMKKEHSPAVLPVAISAWTFLLTTLDGWRLSYKIWQGATSCFSKLLNNKDETVCAAAHNALALISDSNCLEKFSNKSKDFEELPVFSTYNQKSQTYCETINGRKLKLSTQSQIIQMKYLKQFIGEDGFVKHMMKNENFHDIFEFSLETENSCSDILYEPEREEVQMRYFHRPVPVQQDSSLLPFVSRENRQIVKRMTKSSNSSLSKARTLLLKKKRSIQDGENDPFAVDEEGRFK
ncbi:SALT-TOLERANCE 32 [Hibiscus trionum]|uniref:SALT-TOLERANCE 32 n=1 Tax=Hibiscus trionum TaxID=183268 RepID=A0A9W7MEL2_HIBTR|nr:SALT-TOLERANCE 32 [Hibiscus trionum]